MRAFLYACSGLVASTALLAAVAAPVGVKPHPGQGIYKEKCAACHGPNGKPVVPNSPDFSTKAYLKKATLAKMVKVVTDGAGTMPAYKAQLKPAEIKTVTAYVRTLAK